MNKKHAVRLTDQERDELVAVIMKLKGTSQKARRAQIMSKADADSPNGTDHRIAEAFGYRTKTIEKLRLRRVDWRLLREWAHVRGGTGDQKDLFMHNAYFDRNPESLDIARSAQ